MQRVEHTVGVTKTIGLVAHDNEKAELLSWADKHSEALEPHDLVATGTTSNLLEQTLSRPIQAVLSGPMGGDQQIGGLIAELKIDALVFFWDPLEQQPHDPDIKALLRVASVWNLPVACNRATADLLVLSGFLNAPFTRWVPDYERYLRERLN